MHEKALQQTSSGTQLSDAKLVRQLLRQVAAQPSIGQRMKTISAAFLGRPYIVNPLIGSSTEPERMVETLHGFDCVTYIESVLALALSDSAEDFPFLLREIRYVYGEIAWRARHHYMVDWARHNIRRGFLRDVTRGEDVVTRHKTLDLIRELPQRIVSFNYFPRKRLSRISQRMQDGDLIFFVSTRKGLDVFHVGLVIRDGRRVLLRHAAKSKDGVVEQELKEFVRANRMSGFILVRPRERARRDQIAFSRHRKKSEPSPE